MTANAHCATDTAEYQNSNETDDSCSQTGDDLGKFVNDFILNNEQGRKNNDAVHYDAKHNSQNTAYLQTPIKICDYNQGCQLLFLPFLDTV